GVLTRLGVDVAGPPDLYRELRRLFVSRDPVDRKRARVLGQIEGDLSGERVGIASALAPDLLHPSIATKLDRASLAHTLNEAVAHLRTHCSTATAPALRHSLGQIGSRSVESWLASWAARFDRLPDFNLSLPTDGPELVVLGSGAAIRDAGLRYRNCLSDRIADVLAGSRLYVEHPPGPEHPGVIVELRRTSLGWLLEDLYGPSNRRVPKALAKEIRTKLSRAGIATYSNARERGPGLVAMAQYLERAAWERSYKLPADLVEAGSEPEPVDAVARKAA
ncbi:hypothetical protein JNW90_16045, partial [Micromonospora sp. STR1s_5]|nr:hypothetical protein [Micromonospora sp. STR1s_5]